MKQASAWGKTSAFYHRNNQRKNALATKEEKERFFNHGTLPKLKHSHASDKRLLKKHGTVHTELLPEAQRILNIVYEQFGNQDKYIPIAYGNRIGASRASEVIHNYLVEHGVDGMMSVYFSTQLDCSGKMAWSGPMNKYNLPERRNYSMWIKNTADNMYLREIGILSLSNHEIGTHFFRALNDGLQPWYSNRTKFGLGPYKSQDLAETEEGFAALNTVFESNLKYLWGPALLYYTACMSLEMNFKELYDHLQKYIADPELRWKYTLRIKRGRNPTQLGGHAKDQCYFRGAVQILQNLDSIDFNLLYAGKITVNDLPRIKRIARLDCIKTPYFLRDMKNYRRYLRSMIRINRITKPKTAIMQEPFIKPLSGNEKKDKAKGKEPSKQKASIKLVTEAKERIMAVDLPTKYSGENGSGNFEGVTIHNIMNDDTDGIDDCVMYNQLTLEEEESNEESTSSAPCTATNSSPPIIQVKEMIVEKIISSKVSSYAITSRRKSDSFTSITSEDYICSSIQEISDEMEEKGELFTAHNDEQSIELIKEVQDDCAELNNYSTMKPQVNLDKDSLGKYENKGNDYLREGAITPSAKPNCSNSTEKISLHYQPTELTYNPTKHTKQISPTTTEKGGHPTLPSYHQEMRKPRKPVLKSKSRAPKSTKDLKTVKSNGDNSSESKVKKKRNFGRFFEELIPFSRARRKRVLPAPV